MDVTYELSSVPMNICEISSKSINGRRNAKFILHEIFGSPEQYQDNGISWNEEYTRQNMHTVIGMSLKAEFLDSERDMPFGHGLTGSANGKPVFQNAVVVGHTKNPKIEELTLNDVVVKVLTAEAEIDDFTYPNFVKWIEDELSKGNAVTGSVEIASTIPGTPIVYDGGWKEKGRVPKDYIYGGYNIISIKPADNSAVMLELNSAKNLKKESKEGFILDEKLLEQFNKLNEKISGVETKVTELNTLAAKNAEINTLKSSVAEKDGKIAELNGEIETLKTAAGEKDGKIAELNGTVTKLNGKFAEAEKKQIIGELNEAIKEFTDNEKECVKEKITAFNEKPDRVEINSIVTAIKVGIADKVKAVMAEQNSKKQDKKPEDIYGEVFETNNRKESDEGSIY